MRKEVKSALKKIDRKGYATFCQGAMPGMSRCLSLRFKLKS